MYCQAAQQQLSRLTFQWLQLSLNVTYHTLRILPRYYLNDLNFHALCTSLQSTKCPPGPPLHSIVQPCWGLLCCAAWLNLHGLA